MLSSSFQDIAVQNLTFSGTASQQIFYVSSINSFELHQLHWSLPEREDYFLISATGTNLVLIADSEVEVVSPSTSSHSLFNFIFTNAL